ncbi:trans-aconitate methyltransferase [Streptomyces sp. NPDC060000]|uniref:trans-aconitate methyltransferase n=1 Tax=Streptomyces sp. NPDC060000 TaxID=3347031 RepID=UPI0036B77E76
MRKTTATPADVARRVGGIPAQPGRKETGSMAESLVPGDGSAARAASATAGSGSVTRGVGAGAEAVAQAATAGAGAGSGAHDPVAGADGGAADVIAGAGPVARSGERPTVRLRDVGPEDQPRYAPEWLELREPADAAARSMDLLDPLRIRLANLPGRGGLAIHDLGCGTGSMGRWLAPRLDGAQHWILHDRDPYLLHFAAVASPRAGADGSRVTVETRRGDVARLTPDALLGASLVTASALLDVLTREEIETLAAACAGAGCPALLTLSVAGRVEFSTTDPLDDEIAAAFNDHQRRDGLLGPDAVTVACEAFAAHGATVKVHPSPWRLGPENVGLTAQWLRGWVGAAVEERPALAERAETYLAARLAACAAGDLHVTVHHSDLLALARPTGGV